MKRKTKTKTKAANGLYSLINSRRDEMNEDSMIITASFRGELPRNFNKGYNGRWVFIPTPVQRVREAVAKGFRQAVRRPYPKKLIGVSISVFSAKIQSTEDYSDLDTLAHQLIDAISKDAFGINDKGVEALSAIRTFGTDPKEAYFSITGTYRRNGGKEEAKTP